MSSISSNSFNPAVQLNQTSSADKPDANQAESLQNDQNDEEKNKKKKGARDQPREAKLQIEPDGAVNLLTPDGLTIPVTPPPPRDDQITF
ncbi:hypothetical protein [Pseudomonas sp. R76]|uniref:hypothetical protein n=1 Tax=Pseudomonas sp. R76 TaxID=1573711 RepID=UPI00131F5684|nr:hypothetical protein [Pseudomonas sp. R76]QHD05143.1 hypothetical protein PspR76_05135 [Pseudomonas sp. R76]